uniref:BTB domain-containing protein n=1 Tax=Glossina brevipalpis TaxID=37001 RepID=A0A1A9W179_9MUSC
MASDEDTHSGDFIFNKLKIYMGGVLCLNEYPYSHRTNMIANGADEVQEIAESECKNSGYGNAILNRLNKMRVSQKYCDFILDVGGELIHVHKIAISIGSPYFAAMLDADTMERREGIVKLNNVDILAVKSLVEYMYSGTITIAGVHVASLLRAADMFHMQWVKERCQEFLQRNVSLTNTFRMRRSAG